MGNNEILLALENFRLSMSKMFDEMLVRKIEDTDAGLTDFVETNQEPLLRVTDETEVFDERLKATSNGIRMVKAVDVNELMTNVEQVLSTDQVVSRVYVAFDPSSSTAKVSMVEYPKAHVSDYKLLDELFSKNRENLLEVSWSHYFSGLKFGLTRKELRYTTIEMPKTVRLFSPKSPTHKIRQTKFFDPGISFHFWILKYPITHPLFSKSGYFQKRLTESNELVLPQDFPGGPETFEMITLFLYGSTTLVDPFNVAALRCAAEFLEMTEDYCIGNLCERFDIYLNQVVLQSWDDTLIVLQKCQMLLPLSEELLIVSRCIESLAFMSCMEILDPERRRDKPVVTLEALASEAWSSETVKAIASKDLWIKDLIALPFGFYLAMLSKSLEFGLTSDRLVKLQNQIATMLHFAHIEDFLLPHIGTESISSSKELAIMKNIFSTFASVNMDNSASNSIVAELWDTYLALIASDPEMQPTKFMELIELLPISYRQTHDQLYRAMNSFLQAHRDITQEEKGSVCKYLNCQKLSQEACHTFIVQIAVIFGFGGDIFYFFFLSIEKDIVCTCFGDDSRPIICDPKGVTVFTFIKLDCWYGKEWSYNAFKMDAKALCFFVFKNGWEKQQLQELVFRVQDVNHSAELLWTKLFALTRDKMVNTEGVEIYILMHDMGVTFGSYDLTINARFVASNSKDKSAMEAINLIFQVFNMNQSARLRNECASKLSSLRTRMFSRGVYCYGPKC